MAFCCRTFGVGIKRLGPLLAVGLLVVACNRSSGAPSTPVAPLAAAATPTSATTGATIATTSAATATIESTSTQSSTQSSTATFLPTVTSTPPFAADTATVTQTGNAPGSSTGIASQGAIFTSPRYSYTVVLPCCWLALPTSGTAMESALAEMEADGDAPVWGDLGERVRERESGAVLELIALLLDEESGTTPIAQVTVSVLPANGLTLDGYLAATADELNSIANTSVVTNYVEATLGVGSLPASVVEYMAASNPNSTDDSEQTIAGLQVAFFGHDANSLIVLTFTTTTDHYAELEPEFLHIVRTVTLNDPAV